MTDAELPALVAVIVRAPDGATCDGVGCGAPALVSLSLDVRWAPIYRCAAHWPDLHEMLTRRGHNVVSSQ